MIQPGSTTPDVPQDSSPKDTVPESEAPKADAPKADNGQAVPPADSPSTTSWSPQRGAGKWETKLASGGFLLGALLMIREQNRPSSDNLLDNLIEMQQNAGDTPQSFNRRARRSRRLGDK